MASVVRVRLAMIVAIVSLAVSAPAVALAECWGGGGGGGESASMDVKPDTYVWTGHFSREFEIKNTGFSSWTITGWYYPVSGYEIFDPKGCLGKTISSFSSCIIYVHGMPSSPAGTLKVEASKNGSFAASDTSQLNQ